MTIDTKETIGFTPRSAKITLKKLEATAEKIVKLFELKEDEVEANMEKIKDIILSTLAPMKLKAPKGATEPKKPRTAQAIFRLTPR